MTPEEMLARVLYRDGLMLVIDKPAGLPVHRVPKGGASLEDYFDALRYGLPRPPALAHRLDRETSGCLVLGRHRKALAHLGLLFKHGKVGKTYWAVVEGGPEAEEGTIDLPLGRLDVTRGWWMKPDPHGLPAVTKWKVLGRYPSPTGGGWPSAGRLGGGCSEELTPPRAFGATLLFQGRDSLTWLALEPVTGRTHQLRVHCAAMGWPILGDNIYGTQAILRGMRNEKFSPRPGDPGLQLHAREVVVPIAKSRDPVRVVAPVPEHMKEWLRSCGWREEGSAPSAIGQSMASHS